MKSETSKTTRKFFVYGLAAAMIAGGTAACGQDGVGGSSKMTGSTSSGKVAARPATTTSPEKAQLNLAAVKQKTFEVKKPAPDQKSSDAKTKSNPAHPEFENVYDLYKWALAAKKSGRYNEALAAFDDVIKDAPKFSKAYSNRARVLLSLDRSKEALKSAKTAVELDYTDASAHNVVGLSYHDLGLIDQAIASYEEAATQDPKYAWPYNNLALIHIQREEFEKAEPLLRKALAIDASNPTIKNNLGVTLERLGRISDARVAYKSAVNIDSGYTKAISHVERLKGVKDSSAQTAKQTEQVMTAKSPETTNEDMLN